MTSYDSLFRASLQQGGFDWADPDKSGQNTPSPQICPLMINDFQRKPEHRRPVLINEKP